MKKIFGMFAVAALAATALTGCGGGSEDNDELNINKFCYKTLRIQAPGRLIPPEEDGDEGANGGENPDQNGGTPPPITGDGNVYAGAMYVQISEKLTSKKAKAETGFGAKVRQYDGYIEVIGGTPEAPMVTIYLDSTSVGGDPEAQGWFSSFIGEDLEEGDTLLGLPAPYVTFDNWTDRENGTCTVKFTIGNQEAYVTNVSFSLTEN
ncbi:MAG: hypothetical protein II295_02995 [Akkermansia sp.]|nr:hypothetical protein [Akkermansia sp.]